MNDTLSPLQMDARPRYEVAATAPLEARPARSVRSAARSGSYTARLATDEAVRRDAYRLRYRSYTAGGHIEPNSSGLFKDVYDEMPNASTIVIYDSDIPVASVRTCTLARGTNLTSPARDAFREEVDELMNRNAAGVFAGRAIESTRLVRSPEAENNQGLVFLLYRMAGYIGMCAHSQLLLACVRSNHTPFYRRLGYEAASEPRSYPGLRCTMRLMVSDRQKFDKARQAVPAMDPLSGTTGNLDGFFKGEPVTLSLTEARSGC